MDSLLDHLLRTRMLRDDWVERIWRSAELPEWLRDVVCSGPAELAWRAYGSSETVWVAFAPPGASAESPELIAVEAPRGGRESGGLPVRARVSRWRRRSDGGWIVITRRSFVAGEQTREAFPSEHRQAHGGAFAPLTSLRP